jgi:hypothetical protein
MDLLKIFNHEYGIEVIHGKDKGKYIISDNSDKIVGIQTPPAGKTYTMTWFTNNVNNTDELRKLFAMGTDLDRYRRRLSLMHAYDTQIINLE